MPDNNSNGTENAENKTNTNDDSKNTENMIPKARFDQLNQQKKAAEQTLQEIADEFVNDIPEDLRDIVPNLSPAEKIKWVKMAQKKGLFTKPIENGPDSKTPNKGQQMLDTQKMSSFDLMSHGFKK